MYLLVFYWTWVLLYKIGVKEREAMYGSLGDLIILYYVIS